MKLTELYLSTISMCGLSYDGAGRLHYRVPNTDHDIPIMVAKQPLVFPEQRFLEDKRNTDEKVIPLNPLAESFNRSISLVQRKLINCAILRMNSLTDYLLAVATDINGNISNDKASQYPTAITELFMNVDKVDEKFELFLNSIREVINTSSSSKMANYFTLTSRANHVIGTQTYLAVATITSPLYTELAAYLDGDKTEVFGVKPPRKKDAKVLYSLLGALFPKLTEERWVVGSNSGEVPRFISFMTILTEFYTRTNELFQLLGSEANEFKGGITPDIDWDKGSINWGKLRKLVQPDNYNAGQPKENSSDGDEELPRSERVEKKRYETSVNEKRIEKALEDKEPTVKSQADTLVSKYDTPVDRTPTRDRDYGRDRDSGRNRASDYSRGDDRDYGSRGRSHDRGYDRDDGYGRNRDRDYDRDRDSGYGRTRNHYSETDSELPSFMRSQRGRGRRDDYRGDYDGYHRNGERVPSGSRSLRRSRY